MDITAAICLSHTSVGLWVGQVGNNILIIMLSLIAGWLAGWLALHNMNFLTLFLFSWQKSLPGSSPPIGPVIEGGALYFLTFNVFVYLVNITLSINNMYIIHGKPVKINKIITIQ